LDETVRCCEPGNAPTHDDDARRRHTALRPRLRSSTLPLRQLMDGVDERPHVIDRGPREDAVAEVEDVADAPVGLLEDRRRPTPDLGGWCEQGGGTQVPLDPDAGPEPSPALPELDAPV